MNRRYIRYESFPPPGGYSPVARILGAILLVAFFIGAALIGVFVVAGLLVLGVALVAGLRARLWWHQRKLKRKGSGPARRPAPGDRTGGPPQGITLETEYEVVEPVEPGRDHK